jgi:protocatechuate 3,4-dioxygenase beta subunit
MDKALQLETRRSFLKHASLFAVALPAGALLNCARPAQTQPALNDAPRTGATRRVGGYCEGCEAIYEGMPSELNWETRIAPATELGEPLEASGVIYKRDGKTPAPGVILYVYHTDARGIYPPATGATGHARRHGRLRGWVRTNAKGEYKFNTIKPASYPNSNIPSHIHPIIKEADRNEYYIDAWEFDDDPFLTQRERARRRNIGGSGVVRLTKSASGVWFASRDIILGLNVENYD